MQKEAANFAADVTFGVLAHQYLEARKSSWRPKSCAHVTRHLLKYAKPLHQLPITAVTQRNVANLLANVTKASGEPTGNHVRSSLSALFSWVIKEGIRLPEGNVVAYTNKHEQKSRDRVLADTELKAIWQSCRDDDFGAIIKLLILTGQREAEIGGLRWDEVHDEYISLPAQRTKNGRAHIVPLADPAKAILAKFQASDRIHVFGRVDTGFTGWGYAKRQFDDHIAKTKKPLAHWVIHDLRRTVVTRMAELGVQPHIIEAVINHASGHKGGVAGTYNRATYAKQKAVALAHWAERLAAIIEGREPNVTALRRPRHG